MTVRVSRVVAVHQPNFLPWLGFFDKLHRADIFVLLDDAQFPRSGAGAWTNRVRMAVSGKPAWVTVPINRAERGVQTIADVTVDDTQPWRRRILGTIRHSYAQAPAFRDVFPVIAELLENPTDRLAELNEAAIRRLASLLELDDAKIVHSSALGAAARGTQLLIELTRAVGGDVYLSGDGSDAYLEPAKFSDAGVELRFQRFVHPTYPRGDGVDCRGLSAVDALMHCGAKGTARLLGGPAVAAPESR
ncbi:MAG: WbqC family protein [Actinomycetota bacterium]